MKSLFLRLIQIGLVNLCVVGGVYAADYPLEQDVSSIDGIVAAYYAVVSGPVGYQYDAERDRSLHAPGALITRITADGKLQRHDLAAEQQGLLEPYPRGFYEFEIGKLVEQYGDVAHVWSTFETRDAPDGEILYRGVSSISLYYHENRWWIGSWATQNEGDEPLPDRYLMIRD